MPTHRLRLRRRVVRRAKLSGLCRDYVSALLEARFHESVKSDEVLCARSIEPFEGGRWRLRWMRLKSRCGKLDNPEVISSSIGLVPTNASSDQPIAGGKPTIQELASDF